MLILLPIKFTRIIIRGTYQSDFNIDSRNSLPYGITAYNNNFYITDNDSNLPDEVYLYDNTGRYQNQFNLDNDNATPQGIVTYNNKLYVIDSSDDEVYIYNISGTILQGTFNLHRNNTIPRGIEIYKGSFYITDRNTTDSKVYIYPID